MKFKKVEPKLNPNLHIFIYGFPGSGKDKFAADFHKAGQDIVLVTQENATTLQAEGITCPQLQLENEDEIISVLEMPEKVISEVIQKQPGFENYVPKTWFFNNLRLIQRSIFGHHGRKQDTKVFDGALTLEKKSAAGIMALPNSRDAQGVPANKDYRLLDERMRGVVTLIEQMPYNTIVSTHAEVGFTAETRKKLTGDAKTDKNVPRDFNGWPALDGFSLKYDLPGLVGDFYIHLATADQERFIMYPKPTSMWYARNRIAKFMPKSLDWTDKNAYDEIMRRYKKAIEAVTKGEEK